MSMQVTVTLDAEGPVAVKTAHGGDDVARLRLEAERLERAVHPGLVEVVGRAGEDVNGAQANRAAEQGADDGVEGRAAVELRTRFAGDPISHWSGSVGAVAGLGAAVAATLGDLHDIGVVHGRLDATHILVGDDGRPRLCGLSHPGGAAPHDDIAALGRVLGEVLERATREPRSWPWRGRSSAAHRRPLEQVLARACDPVPSRRPNARLLASSILSAVPGAELPAAEQPFPGPEPAYVPPDEELLDLVFTHELSDDERWAQAFGDDPPDPVGAPRQEPAPGPGGGGARARIAAGSGAVAVAAIAASAVFFVGGWGSRGSAAPPKAVRASPAGQAGCPVVAAPAADVDGDGCPEALVVDDGGVSAGAARWTLGEPDDVIAVGDWDCDGRAAPALLRPATGDVFVFPGWAAEGEPVTVEARDRLPGAVAIRGERAEGGCDDLVVDLGSGATATVEVRP
jgi:eukaryotic-like serine/threonine-protein kinase